MSFTNRIIMYNETTGDIAGTACLIGGPKWKKFIREGFKPVGKIRNWGSLEILKLDEAFFEEERKMGEKAP